MIERGADVNYSGWMGTKPLHIMVENDRYDVVGLLIAHGANVQTTRQYGITPLHLAKNAKMARLLIEHGASVNFKNKWGETAFFTAVKSGNLEYVNLCAESQILVRCKRFTNWTAQKCPHRNSSID